MVMTAGPRPVVVGVDGTEDNVGAVRFAIDEARHTGSGVTLVHVVPDPMPVAPMLPLETMDLTEAGEQLLARAEKQFAELGSDVAVETELRRGGRAAELVAAARHARLLVVGRDVRPLLERLVMGDVTTGVAARAQVPVTVVPGEAVPRRRHGVVVVGLQSPTDPGQLLTHAFVEAAHRGARLLVLHAWWLPSGYDDLVSTPEAEQGWEAHVRREVEQVLAPHRARHCGVPVSIRVVHDHPGRALVDASREADLVVLSRREHGLLAALHLGTVARAVLRGSEAPVRVVPPPVTGA